MIVIVSKEEKEILARLRRFETDEATRRSTFLGQIGNLRDEIETLKIEKGRKQEEHAKEERELRHMIGLEKKRQEFEIESAKKETALAVREGNLAAEKARFEEHLKFNTDRFEKMESYLKDTLKEVLARLPNVTMEITRGGK